MKTMTSNLKENRTYLVKQVNLDGSILLSNGSVIKLLGVQQSDNRFVGFLQELLKGKKVICKMDPNLQNKNYYYVYVWGQNSKVWGKYFDKNALEFFGLLDVEDGFGSPKKGLALFLNATLVKSGQSLVDTTFDFEMKDQFIKWQK